jgi:hypothetical protein
VPFQRERVAREGPRHNFAIGSLNVTDGNINSIAPQPPFPRVAANIKLFQFRPCSTPGAKVYARYPRVSLRPTVIAGGIEIFLALRFKKMWQSRGDSTLLCVLIIGDSCSDGLPNFR